MNLSVDNIEFQAQHTNKCYCQNDNICCCTGLKNSEAKSTPHKFIKIRNEGNRRSYPKLRQQNSFSPSSVQTLLTPISTSASSGQQRLTERREFYENSKSLMDQRMDSQIVDSARHQANASHLFSNDMIAELQEFRMRNADECLSTCSRYTMNNKWKSKVLENESDIINIKYTLNKRGLLESLNDGPLQSNNKVPIAFVTDTKAAVRDILRQKMSASSKRDTFLRKALCQPDKSLALKYQKTH